MSDLISRQAAIEVADAVWAVTGDKNVAKVWKQINDLPSEHLEQRWIPRSERLPDKKGYYLVTRKNPKGHVTRVRFNPEQVERGTYNSPWGNGDADILAWMPLPEPYEEELEDD